MQRIEQAPGKAWIQTLEVNICHISVSLAAHKLPVCINLIHPKLRNNCYGRVLGFASCVYGQSGSIAAASKPAMSRTTWSRAEGAIAPNGQLQAVLVLTT